MHQYGAGQFRNTAIRSSLLPGNTLLRTTITFVAV
jgi:hypothetical protein